MGTSKTEHFTSEQNEIAALAKAIGHPARVAIVEHLLTVDSCIVKDITNQLPLAATTILQHLKALKDVGLIQGTIEGKSVCYCLNYKAFERLNYYFLNITQKITPINDDCCS